MNSNPQPGTPVPPPPASPPGSSAGWTFPIWLSKNKNLLKQAVSYIAAVFTGIIGMIHVVPSGPWAIVVTALVGLATLAVQFGTRLALDWIDYRYTNNPA